MWKEEFGVDILTDPMGSWEWTDCEVEPLFEISCLGGGGWQWSVKKRLWLNNQFKVIYIEEGTTKGIEDALMSAMSKFEEVLTEGYTQEELDKIVEGVENGSIHIEATYWSVLSILHCGGLSYRLEYDRKRLHKSVQRKG